MSIRSSKDPAEAEAIKSDFGRDMGLRKVFRLLGNRQRLSFAWLIVIRIAVGICDLLLAGSMYLLFVMLQGGSPPHHLWWVPKTTLSAAWITSSLVILRAAMDLFSTRAVISHIQNLYREFLLQLTHGYSEMNWSRFVECNRSELLNHTMNTAREAANFCHHSIEMAAAVTVVAIMTGALWYESPVAACGLGAAVTLFYGIHRSLIREKLQVAATEREQSLRMIQRSLADVLSSGREIRTYGSQAFFNGRIWEQSKWLAANNVRIAIFPQIARILSDQGVVLLFLCIIVALQLRHGDVRQVLSLLVFYFVLSRRLLPLISQISFIAGQMEGSYENVRLLDVELNECRRHRTIVSAIQLPGVGYVMELDQVSFSFEGNMSILQNIDLRLKRGETVVLRGVSGSGKSSLLNLIAGVLQPVTGVVRVDRASVAYVPQDVVLLDDSIRNNLLFGLEVKSDAELMKALAVANLTELVAAQPLGLEAEVGDNGALFSGGQRQRLGIARAVLRGAGLLLLDEATSGLDEQNEAQILESLSTSGMAVLLVTHRTHKKSFPHRIVRLHDGRLIEELSMQGQESESAESLYSFGRAARR